MRGIGLAIIAPFCLVEALKIVGGVALLRRRSWGRIMILILAFMSIPLPPIGTAYGVYAIVVLLKDETAKLFASAADG